ncbi:MAG TPA: hypothetical protein VN748_05545 [Pseudonocardiaceae bacterium]|nr:hypothetical protein [Pseudonocardiaceae bacterium]
MGLTVVEGGLDMSEPDDRPQVRQTVDDDKTVCTTMNPIKAHIPRKREAVGPLVTPEQPGVSGEAGELGQREPEAPTGRTAFWERPQLVGTTVRYQPVTTA